MEKGGPSSIAGGSENLYSHTGKQPGSFSDKMEIVPLEDSGISILGIYPKDAVLYHNNTCSTMFTAVLAIKGKSWKTTQMSLN